MPTDIEQSFSLLRQPGPSTRQLIAFCWNTVIYKAVGRWKKPCAACRGSEREIVLETFANGQCSMGYWLTPLVHAHVIFDSRLMHQFKEFDKAVYAIINEFTLISTG